LSISCGCRAPPFCVAFIFITTTSDSAAATTATAAATTATAAASTATSAASTATAIFATAASLLINDCYSAIIQYTRNQTMSL